MSKTFSSFFMLGEDSLLMWFGAFLLSQVLFAHLPVGQVIPGRPARTMAAGQGNSLSSG